MRPAREIMGDLAATGMTPDQIALVMELSAAVSAEARPVADEAAARRRERDKEYQAQKRNERRQISADSDDTADATPFPAPPNENNLTPPTHTPEYNTPRAKAEAHVADWLEWREKNPFPRQHWSPKPLWSDFLKNRKAKTLPNTVAAHDKLLRDIEAACLRTRWPPGKVFRACVEQGWGAIYDTPEMKEAINGRQPANQQISRGGSGKRDSRDGFERACDRLIERAEAGRQPDGGIGSGGQRALAAPRAL